jgi:acetoacetyl-CoA reductase
MAKGEGRVAVVTGGTRGIGKAICADLHTAGYKVVANYATNEEAAEAFRKETGVMAMRWDVANFDECRESIKKIEAECGRAVDVLINNAGITRDGAIHKMSRENWDAVIETNLTSCFNMVHCVIDGMRERRFGRIVTISSVNGQLGQFGQTNYSAAKAGIFGFTKALARETAARGITVNAVAPGYIGTDMVRAVAPDILEKIIANIPVGRLGEATEIARAVCFLVADEAGFITGETLSVNGGQHME